MLSNDDLECVSLQLCLFSGPIANVQNPMVIGFIGNQPGRGFFEGRIDDVSTHIFLSSIKTCTQGCQGLTNSDGFICLLLWVDSNDTGIF